VHENCGYTGKAVPDNIQRYRVKMLREMGANGYRTAHYPHSEAMMDALDENGFIVMNETRWFESTDEGKEQLSTLVRRDRNRPSVIFWSIGNEEPHHCTEQGVRICRSLVPLVKKLDSSRPVMTAVTHAAAIVFDEVDVVGTNYLWKHIDNIRANTPHKPFVSSECGATGTTRGWYYDDDPTRGFINAYDHDTNTAFISRENTWKRINSYPWMMGGYQWTAFEYRGEAMWPRLCSQSGAIDLYLQKKDAFYQNQSHWSDQPMVHLLPHWNFRGREGEPIRVFAYTNQPEAELFLNGVSMGKVEIERFGHGEWSVPYAAGKLEVRAGKNGEVLATDVRVTTGKAASLKLILDTEDVRCGDTAIVTCVVLDENGNEVPDACPTVSFMAGGAAKVYSTGGAVNDHVSIFSPDRKMWMGRVGVALKLAAESGTCKVYATSEGLTSASLTFEIQ
jgi:beta-galactosidase